MQVECNLIKGDLRYEECPSSLTLASHLNAKQSTKAEKQSGAKCLAGLQGIQFKDTFSMPSKRSRGIRSV